MKKKKIIPAILAGVALLSINSSVKATDYYELKNVQQMLSDDGKQMSIEYRPKSLSSSGTKFLSNVFSRFAENNVGVSLPSSYIPTFKGDLKVKNQLVNGIDSTECWANSFASACEAYNYANGLANSGEEYSGRHINYSCSNVFANQTITKNAFNRDAKTSNGGNFYLDFAYAMNKQGPVLESDMPSTGNVSYINSDQLETENDIQLDIKEYSYFPAVYKKYLDDGSIEYYNGLKYATKEYKDKIDNVSLIRNTIKQQIKENGAVMATIYQVAPDKDIYMQPIEESNQIVPANHAVCIVGWDDNYFPENDDYIYGKMTGWKNKGAYIALNSYGDDMYYDGYVYISYDDFYVEQFVAGIKTAEIADSDYVYLHDELGTASNTPISKNDGSGEALKNVSVVNIFDRTTVMNEKLKGIGIPSYADQLADVYYTETFNTDGTPTNFKVLKQNMDIGIGETYLDLSNIKLTKSKFAICVTYKGKGSYAAEIPIELKNDTLYKYAISKEGESYIIYTDTSDLSFDYTSSSMYKFTTLKDKEKNIANFGIRAYIEEENNNPTPTPTPSESVTPTPKPTSKITSTKYKINNNLITRVPTNTTMNEFKNSITVDGEYQIVDKNDKAVATTLVRTGYKVKIGNEVYTISVVSDISGSGANEYTRVLDIAKIRAHIVGLKGSILTGAQLDAADINGNGQVDVIDLAKMRKICVE